MGAIDEAAVVIHSMFSLKFETVLEKSGESGLGVEGASMEVS